VGVHDEPAWSEAAGERGADAVQHRVATGQDADRAVEPRDELLDERVDRRGPGAVTGPGLWE